VKNSNLVFFLDIHALKKKIVHVTYGDDNHCAKYRHRINTSCKQKHKIARWQKAQSEEISGVAAIMFSSNSDELQAVASELIPSIKYMLVNVNALQQQQSTTVAAYFLPSTPFVRATSVAAAAI
jgi:hypothetical protein